MKLKQAVEKTIDEDTFYELAADAYQVYQGAGGTALDIDDYLKLHKAKAMPWHVAKKEKEFKSKFKVSNEKIKQRLFEYFFRKKK